jgi:hypothetical protein
VAWEPRVWWCYLPCRIWMLCFVCRTKYGFHQMRNDVRLLRSMKQTRVASQEPGCTASPRLSLVGAVTARCQLLGSQELSPTLTPGLAWWTLTCAAATSGFSRLFVHVPAGVVAILLGYGDMSQNCRFYLAVGRLGATPGPPRRNEARHMLWNCNGILVEGAVFRRAT